MVTEMYDLSFNISNKFEFDFFLKKKTNYSTLVYYSPDVVEG